MMREGKYIIDSIENGLVKLLYTDDETIEEIVRINEFTNPIKQGDVIDIQVTNNKMNSILLEEETKSRRHMAQRLLNKLKKNKP